MITKRNEDLGAADRVLKFWLINAILLIIDILESLLFKYLFKQDYVYWIYIICKSAFFTFLFVNNFHNAATIYDSIIPSTVTTFQPHIETTINKVDAVVGYHSK